MAFPANDRKLPISCKGATRLPYFWRLLTISLFSANYSKGSMNLRCFPYTWLCWVVISCDECLITFPETISAINFAWLTFCGEGDELCDLGYIITFKKPVADVFDLIPKCLCKLPPPKLSVASTIAMPLNNFWFGKSEAFPATLEPWMSSSSLFVWYALLSTPSVAGPPPINNVSTSILLF